MKLPELDIGILAPKTCFSAVRPFAVSVAFAAAILCLSVACKPEAVAPEVSTPRKTVQAFDNAVARNDLKLARSLVSGIDDDQFAYAKMAIDLQHLKNRMAVALAKRFHPKDKIGDSQSHWENASEQIEGDKATVQMFLGPSFALEKKGEKWRIDLSASPPTDASGVASRKALLATFDEIAAKLEKDQYKTEQEVIDDYKSKLALVSAGGANPQASQPAARARSDTSLAIEKYLRARLVGGATDAQIVALSDVMAAKFDAAPIPDEDREHCFTGTGANRQLRLWYVLMLATGDVSPSEKATAASLQKELADCVPPRIVFRPMLFDDHGSTVDSRKPLPAKPDAEVRERGPGDLISEYLLPFEAVMDEIRLTDPRIWDEHPPKWAELPQYKTVDVLCVGYFAETTYAIRTSYYWYQKAPPGLDSALNALPPDHPIRQIGPAQSEAPERIAVVARAPGRPRESDMTIGDKILTGVGALFAIAAMDDIAAHNEAEQKRERVRKIVNESGGTKVECPKCHGSGKILREDPPIDDRNPYSPGTEAWKTYEDGIDRDAFQRSMRPRVTCDKCRGTGVVDK